MTPAPPTRMFLTPTGAVCTMEEYKLVLERKRAAIQQMCQGLEEYLTIDIDTALEAIEHPTKPPENPHFAPGYYPPYKPSEEEFVAACSRLESLERGMAEAQAAYDGLKDEGPEAALRASLAMQMRCMEDSLDGARRTRDGMQKALESHAEATE